MPEKLKDIFSRIFRKVEHGEVVLLKKEMERLADIEIEDDIRKKYKQ